MKTYINPESIPDGAITKDKIAEAAINEIVSTAASSVNTISNDDIKEVFKDSLGITIS
jgi:hypothetical protein